MADFDLNQTGQEVQDILNGAAMQTDLTAETERAELAEQTLQGGIDAEETRAKAAEKQNADDIDLIEAKIPAGASSENQLADKLYVNNAVATASATYRGSYNEVSDLSLTIDATHEQIATALAGAISTADNNDYAFVQIPTSTATPTQIAAIERYKFNGTAWMYEYTLNNSGFTTDQWAALNSGITSGLVAKLIALPTNEALTLALAGKQDVLTFDNVPVSGSNNPVKSGGVYSAIDDEATRAKAAEKANADDIDDIEAMIPTAASDENQLADKQYVNDGIATASATYRGSYNEVSDLSLTIDATHAQIAAALAVAISTADNNDYCFVQIPTSDATPTQIAAIERYKFNGTAWAYEYTLNNSGFTASQWAALNSGITSGLVAKLSALPTNDALTLALAGKQDVLTFDNVPVDGSNNPVKSGGVYDAINAEATTRAAAIAAIVALIPEAASALNQLADKAFVNSSISTATAVFKGTYNVVVDLELSYNATQEQIATMLASKIISADNNDYCFVQIPTSDAAPLQIARTDRYKFNGTAWAYEYTLNNSGFTAAQWAAINSGITSLLKDKLIDLPTATELTALLAAKQNQLTFDTTPTTGSTNPVTSGGIKSAIDAEKARAEAAEADRYTKSETYNKTEINGLVSTPHQNYVTVPTYASLPSSGQSTDTIYRVSSYDGANNQVDDTVYSEYAWDGTQYVFLRVNSQIEEVFDITVYNNNTKYADLSAALGVDGANIPQSLQKGGMSVKFVQSSDNKYVQYRLLTDEWSTNTENWSLCGDNVLVENPEFIEAKTDAEAKLLEGTKRDGTKYLAWNLEVKGNIINEGLQEQFNSKVDFAELDTKIDKIKNGINNEDILSFFEPAENPEWLDVTLDDDRKVLGGRNKDGKVIEYVGIETTHVDADKIQGNIVEANKLNLTPEGIENLKEDLNIADTDIISLNPEAPVQLDNLVFPYAYNTTSNDILSIAFISDIHANTTNLIRFREFFEHYSTKINVMLHGGDIVRGWFNDQSKYVDVAENAGCQKMLNCIGNHDVAYWDGEQIVWDYYKEDIGTRRVDVYNKFVGQFVSQWGVTQPSGAAANGLCYFYKDFTDAKVRLIVLDCTESGQYMTDQMTWLDSVMRETLEENSSVYGYSIVIAQHYNPASGDSQLEMFDCPFTSSVHIAYLVSNQTLLGIVDQFQSDGGKFVTYLVGHVHRDYLGYIKYSNDRKQMFVEVATGAAGSGSARDFSVAANKKSLDCFDVIGIDTTRHLLKIMRVGADYDMTMRKKAPICVDYSNCLIIK